MDVSCQTPILLISSDDCSAGTQHTIIIHREQFSSAPVCLIINSNLIWDKIILLSC